MPRATYDDPMVEWLATVHDVIERLADQVSDPATDSYDSWEWVFEKTDEAVDIDESTDENGLLTEGEIGGLIYLGPIHSVHPRPVIGGVREVEATAARWFETFAPASIMCRIEAERAILEEWQNARQGRPDSPHAVAMHRIIGHLATGWAHMPGYRAGWAIQLLARV